MSVLDPRSSAWLETNLRRYRESSRRFEAEATGRSSKDAIEAGDLEVDFRNWLAAAYSLPERLQQNLVRIDGAKGPLSKAFKAARKTAEQTVLSFALVWKVRNIAIHHGTPPWEVDVRYGPSPSVRVALRDALLDCGLSGATKSAPGSTPSRPPSRCSRMLTVRWSRSIASRTFTTPACARRPDVGRRGMQEAGLRAGSRVQLPPSSALLDPDVFESFQIDALPRRAACRNGSARCASAARRSVVAEAVEGHRS